MPELPEVESIRLSLTPLVLGRRVIGARLVRRDVMVAAGDPFGGLGRQRTAGRQPAKPAPVSRRDLLGGLEIVGLERKGKQLAMIGRAPDGQISAIVVQLGMSGQLIHRSVGERVPQNSHIHAWWRLSDGSRIVFRDPRRFGGLRALASHDDLLRHWSLLGPDGLNIRAAALASAAEGSSRAIKVVLLDQGAIAGVGNIYADEALFMAGISPHRKAGTLRPPDHARLARAIRGVLSEAVAAGGSTLRDYVDADGNPGTFQLQHLAYGRGGQPCLRCGTRLRTAAIGQRTTVWCGRCQA